MGINILIILEKKLLWTK